MPLSSLVIDLATALTRPLDGSVDTLLTQYALFMGIGIVCNTSFRLAHRWFVAPLPSLFETYDYQTVAVSAVCVAPLAEEVVFRALPLLLPPDLRHPALAGATGLWAVLHGRRGAVFAATGGWFFVKLWVYGLGAHAILAHALHNLVAVTLLIAWHWWWTDQSTPATPRLSP